MHAFSKALFGSLEGRALGGENIYGKIENSFTFLKVFF